MYGIRFDDVHVDEASRHRRRPDAAQSQTGEIDWLKCRLEAAARNSAGRYARMR